ncbi:MAG TPA: hypothetical protein VFR02_04015 [bacterium]|nr:hypothetical protein [bacterium]
MARRSLVLGAVLFLAGCGQPPPVGIDLLEAKKIADQTALDYFDANAKDLYPRLDARFHSQVHDPADLARVIRHIRFLYGKPVAYDYKAATRGQHEGPDGITPYVDLWYVLRTDKYPKGDHYLKIEVVQAQGATFPDLGGFGVLDFPDGLPAYLQ